MKQPDLWSHLAAAGIVTVIIGLIYGTVQQAHRATANDPQIQLARDLASKLKTDTVSVQLTAEKIQLESSLAVFTALFDMNGEPLQSTGTLDGRMPQLPKGVFEYAKKNGENKLTWQPKSGVRMAMVICPVLANGIGYVAAGRSLREVEKRVSNVTLLSLFGWLACIGIIVGHWIIVFIQYKKRTNN